VQPIPKIVWVFVALAPILCNLLSLDDHNPSHTPNNALFAFGLLLNIGLPLYGAMKLLWEPECKKLNWIITSVFLAFGFFVVNVVATIFAGCAMHPMQLAP
jgi:hypothetical protein